MDTPPRVDRVTYELENEANRAAAALFDTSVEDMIGLPVAHFVEEAGRATFSEMLAESARLLSGPLNGNFSNVEIGVQDGGAGIPPEDRQIVFEAFRRGEGENTHRTKGAGLGLAICKHLIEAHGGKIWLQEHAGPGTLIMFTLPVATARPGQPRPLAARESSAGIIG